MNAVRTVTPSDTDLSIDDPCVCGAAPCAMVGDCLEQALRTDDRFGLYPVRDARRLLVAV